MMGTLHAKEDYSQYPISDSLNDHDQNSFGQNDHGLDDFNTQGETAIPAQLEHHTETEQVSERVRSIIGGKNMFRVHNPSDDSTWQDATQKTAHWGELSEGGGHAGTLPTPPNTHTRTITTQHQPHNINLKSSMLEATINNYCITEQLQLRSDNSQRELLPKGCTDAMINSEFCYGDSSIMGARLREAQPRGARLHGAQPHDYGAQPHDINLQASMLEATINNYCITEQLQLRSDNSHWELLPKGCTDAMINSEFCYGDSSIMGARLRGAQPRGAQPHDYGSQPHDYGSQPHDYGSQPHESESASTGKHLLDIGSPQDVAAAYSSMSSASSASSASPSTLYRTLSKTLSKVMTSYTESTDAHGSIANNRHALELVRDIERSFHGKTITVSA